MVTGGNGYKGYSTKKQQMVTGGNLQPDYGAFTEFTDKVTMTHLQQVD